MLQLDATHAMTVNDISDNQPFIHDFQTGGVIDRLGAVGQVWVRGVGDAMGVCHSTSVGACEPLGCR